MLKGDCTFKRLFPTSIQIGTINLTIPKGVLANEAQY